MNYRVMTTEPLIVVGSVRDKHLAGPRFEMMDRGKMAKVVRISIDDFLNDLCVLIREIGTENLAEIRCYRDLKGWRTAVHAAKGRIGAFVMDSRAFVGIRDERALLEGIQLWMVHEDQCKMIPSLS
jgi:hypothetical protein